MSKNAGKDARPGVRPEQDRIEGECFMNVHVPIDENSGDKNPGNVDYGQYLGCDTIGKLFAKRCAQYGERTAHREKDHGIWKSYSWNEYYKRAEWICLGLVKLGLKPGQVVSILSEDNKEWLYFDMATVCAGGIASGVYTTDAASQLAFLVNDSDTKFLIVENDEQLDKFLEVRDQMKGLKKVIIIDSEGLRDFKDDKVLFLDELYEIGRAEAEKKPEKFAKLIAKGKPDDVRMLIYTSGTTGKPKGAMITHANIMFQLNSLYQVFENREDDEVLCFLPLCHVLERLFSVESQLGIGNAVNFAESPETVFENLQEVSPHVFVAVPRLWEKIYSRLQIMRKEATVIGRWAFDSALKAGQARAKYVKVGDTVPT
ncbi:MAG: AMP-binding protein, partial [Rhizobiaceae bacterium]|nr:AMP-binding protein [Rhizobiaceae bacterium]